ncbi:M56 family metallopeptidase [Nocardia ninae]|uniref:Peptidase M48 domain-containing protein n=1 Tax=Nocardia ninae NBRC 108245 TaxID=1210091 RepID=A0A511M750_9NOCA|nr:M56 family metallopeptidase [Nocardia ninae]GEM36473.1 hypothetical protein NN4_09920 [Nocardia ninae NBRC 108245]
MSSAVCLLVYSALVSVMTPRLLPRVTAGGRAPAFAVAVWLAALTSVLASWMAAAVALIADAIRIWHKPDSSLLGTCFAVLRSVLSGNDGSAARLAVIVLTSTLSGFVAVLGFRVLRSVARTRVTSTRHARSVQIIGRRVQGVDGLVIDVPEKAVYSVAGRHRTVVITTAALAVLEKSHLDAVLAHERAHLTGRHHLILAATRALAGALPRVKLFTVAETEVARLLEMCADDRAAQDHGKPAVLGAILSLAGAVPIPRGALGAATVSISARVVRLAAPANTVRRVRSLIQLTAFGVVVASTPVLALSGAAHGAVMCLPFTS